MNESDIRKYAVLMKELELTGLEIKENDCFVRLERAGAAASTVTPVSAQIQTQPAAFEPSSDHISVSSPMIGTFYAAPAENAEPFVKVGDRVQPGSKLCIIESMKLMNEITADHGGTIMEICVKNGQVVDYGCELFRIRRSMA